MTKIQPTILKGTRDFLPQEMMQRNRAMAIIKEVFERFGYLPIETPIICPAETILGKYGEEGDRLTYAFKDRGERLIALPYDLTVPFARFVAANYQELPIPFKRYQIQRVWRAEKPQKGRLREFYQCDIDIIGSKSLICEAEIAKVITIVFAELGLPEIVIKANSRRLMNAILSSYGVEGNNVILAIRIIDKILKIGVEAVIAELKDLGISNAEKIISILAPEDSNTKTLQKLAEYDVSELENFLNYCHRLNIAEDRIAIDPTLARGLDYYTGLTFEVVTKNKDIDFGSICAGGRYDDLCSIFSNQDFSGVGVAFGFERIMLLLEKLNLFSNINSPSQVLVTIFDKDLVADALEIYNKLIAANIAAEIYFEPEKLSRQFKFADKKKIPLVVIRGSDELAKNEITIKLMQTGQQETIPLNHLIDYLAKFNQQKS